ncbi:unnamed protein product [Urochloa humidicola]
MIGSVRSLAALVELMSNAGSESMAVVVPGLDSVRDAPKMYANIKNKMNGDGWSCCDIEKLEQLAMVAVGILQIEEELIPLLARNNDDIGAFIGIYNVVVTTSAVLEQIQTSNMQLYQLGKSIEDAFNKVQEGEKTMQWFVDFTSNTVTKLLNEVEVNFV